MRPGDKAKHRTLDDWLGDIRRDAELIVQNTAGKTCEEFAADIVLQDHVVRRLANIGEAVKYIGQFHEGFQEQVTHVPWRDLARTRDVVNHAYFTIDPKLIWSMARKDMPDILSRITTVINNRLRGRAMQFGIARHPDLQ